MYCLIDFCCICFYNKENLRPLSDSDSDDITYFVKLTSCIPEMYFNQMNRQRLICNKCCENINTVYKFRQICLKSKTTFRDYISQLHQVSNISGRANVYLTDINKFDDVKTGYQTEKIEDFKKIKMVNNPITLKLIETGDNFIQLGNVIIKMEPKNQNSQEYIEESFDNILVNQDENKIDVCQNDIKLPANEIKKKYDYQDFEEYLHDDNLETCDSENDDMITKVKENNNYSLYLEKNSDDQINLDEIKILNNSSTHLDEIKIEIVDNDIKSVNSEIYYQYTEDNFNSMIDQDKIKTDKEVIFFHKSLEEKQKMTSLSEMQEQQKNCNIVNRNFETVKKYEYTVQSTTLIKHTRIKTGNEQHKCDICQKNFTRAYNLKTHMKIHTGEKPHECSVCQKKFTKPYNLREHMQSHIGGRLYECSVCHKKFSWSSNLREHMRIHTGEKPHECSVCQKKFSRSFTLREHMKVHTGEKPHNCSVCHKKFTRSFNLREHMKIHTGEKSECSVCRKKLTHITTFKEHMKTHIG